MWEVVKIEKRSINKWDIPLLVSNYIIKLTIVCISLGRLITTFLSFFFFERCWRKFLDVWTSIEKYCFERIWACWALCPAKQPDGSCLGLAQLKWGWDFTCIPLALICLLSCPSAFLLMVLDQPFWRFVLSCCGSPTCEVLLEVFFRWRHHRVGLVIIFLVLFFLVCLVILKTSSLQSFV